MSDHPKRPSIRWGAIAIGAMAGLVVALLGFIVLVVAGLIAPGPANIVLLFLLFLSLVVAGYVAGRLSESPEVNGGLAALLSAFVSGLISVSSGDVPLLAIITLVLVAAALGSAGGVLARWQRDTMQ